MENDLRRHDAHVPSLQWMQNRLWLNQGYCDGLMQKRRNSIVKCVWHRRNSGEWRLCLCHSYVGGRIITVTSHKHHGVSNLRQLGSLPRLTSKETIASLTLCEGNAPATGGFFSRETSNAESVSMSWCHHDGKIYPHDAKCNHTCVWPIYLQINWN